MTDLKAMDVMGFAGSFAAGVDQAGFDVIGKREPAKFGGFGVASMTYNMPWVEAQVSLPEHWDLPTERVDMVYGCPPCSGFSGLSFVNTAVHGTVVGPDAEINECMTWFVDYVARAKPRIAVMESVALAFKNGQEFMEELWQRLVEKSGIDYHLTHVVMQNALIGGDVIRPRYFFVASTEPFGVGLEYVEPRTSWEVIQDLGDASMSTPDQDLDWGHVVNNTAWSQRITDIITWLKEQGLDWAPGTRLPENIPAELKLSPPEFLLKADGSRRSARQDVGIERNVHSVWFSTDPFSSVRWKPDKPFGVVVAASLGRAIHPYYDRNFTWRELARFMSLPDTWSLRKLIEQRRDGELGKAVTAAAGKWIAYWAKMALEGTPGEYAGRDTSNPKIRIIDVRDSRRVAEIVAGTNPGDAFWPDEMISSSDPSLWLIDRKARPREWWQLEDDGTQQVRYEDMDKPKVPRALAEAKPLTPPGTRRTVSPATPPVARAGIARIQPEVVQTFLDSIGLSKAEAAEKLGVSTSRINEMTGHHRPKSWLNAERWPEVQATLRG